jgi:hypothetical protein
MNGHINVLDAMVPACLGTCESSLKFVVSDTPSFVTQTVVTYDETCEFP